MITINPQIDFFVNEKEEIVVLFIKNSNDIFTLNNVAYVIFKELSKKNLKDLNECLQLVHDFSLTNHVFFTILDQFVLLKFVISDLNISDYKNFIDTKTDFQIENYIKKANFNNTFYEPILTALAKADGDGGESDIGIAVPPFHALGDGYS